MVFCLWNFNKIINENQKKVADYRKDDLEHKAHKEWKNSSQREGQTQRYY